MLIEDLFGDYSSTVTQIRARRARVPNKNRDFKEAKERFMKFYFKNRSVYSEWDFERRFRLPRILYERIKNCIVGCNDLFTVRYDAAKKQGIDPEIRLIACLRLLEYGSFFDQIDELCSISESACRESFISFVTEIVRQFGTE